MRCELKDTFKFDGRFCRTLLPERLMFQHFGLSQKQALRAAFEYFAGAGYIFFGNLQRDSSLTSGKIGGWIGKQIVKPFMHKPVRKAVAEANIRIGIYEANNADLDSYIRLVDKSGQNFYEAIVMPEGGNHHLASKFGGTLASLTSLEDMISNREYDLKRLRYNPIKTAQDLALAQEMFAEYRDEAIQMMGDVLNNERLQQETFFNQGKATLDYVLSTRGVGLATVAATAPLTMGCVCQDIANYKVCGEPGTTGGVTCGGIAVALVIAYFCCGVGQGGSQHKES